MEPPQSWQKPGTACCISNALNTKYSMLGSSLDKLNGEQED